MWNAKFRTSRGSTKNQDSLSLASSLQRNTKSRMCAPARIVTSSAYWLPTPLPPRGGASRSALTRKRIRAEVPTGPRQRPKSQILYPRAHCLNPGEAPPPRLPRLSWPLLPSGNSDPRSPWRSSELTRAPLTTPSSGSHNGLPKLWLRTFS